METKARRSLTYKRETYRLWFEYLRLARMSAKKDIRDALKRTAAFYAPWGNVTGIQIRRLVEVTQLSSSKNNLSFARLNLAALQ